MIVNRRLSLLQIFQAGPGTHPVSYLIGPGVLSRAKSDRRFTFNTFLHPAPSLRMNGIYIYIYIYIYIRVFVGREDPIELDIWLIRLYVVYFVILSMFNVLLGCWEERS